MLRVILIILWVGVITESSAAETPAVLHDQGRLAFQRHDMQGAMDLFEQAATLGHSPSQVQLGWILDSIGEHQKAFVLYQQAAESNNAEGQYFVGEKFVAGEGVEKNDTEAIKWITKAAESGHASAIRRLVIAHENGTLGLPQDATLATQWLQRGTAQNDVWSIKRLAKAYRNGELGFSVDEAKSAQLESLLEQSQ